MNKIGVICAYQFPEGMAPTIRILAYCKGLQKNGVKTEVFTFKGTPVGTTEPLDGIVEGIPYHKSYLKHGDGCQRIIDWISMAKRLSHQIEKSHKKEPFDCLLLSFDTPDKLYTIVPLLKAKGHKLLFIGDEFPEPIRRLKAKIPEWYRYAYKFIYRYIDGRILMTENLKNYYDTVVCPKPTFILNSIIDEERFAGIERQPVEQPYLCYMGNMELAKDNVDNIIQAYSMVADEYPQYQLWLYGTPNSKDRAIIEGVIRDCKMEDRVFIKGRVDYAQVPQILANAALLVTSQPITKRAGGGFPTKMAEYMMSRTPMIVTNVGEIYKYVQDGVNTYMVDPCQPDQYADKLRYALSNQEESAAIAEKAYLEAKTNYCGISVTKALIDFISSLW